MFKNLCLVGVFLSLVLAFQNCGEGPISVETLEQTSSSLIDISHCSANELGAYEICYNKGKHPDSVGNYSFSILEDELITIVLNAEPDTLVCTERIQMGASDSDRCTDISNFTMSLGELEDWQQVGNAMFQSKNISSSGLATGGILRRYFLVPNHNGQLIEGQTFYVSELFFFPRN